MNKPTIKDFLNLSLRQADTDIHKLTKRQLRDAYTKVCKLKEKLEKEDDERFIASLEKDADDALDEELENLENYEEIREEEESLIGDPDMVG